MSDLVSGDAVVRELRLARLPSRALAFGIDLVLLGVVFLLLVTIAGSALGGLNRPTGVVVALVLVLAVFVALPVTVEALSRGRSVGKIVLGLRVVREDGGPAGFREALTRGAAGFVVDFGVCSLFTGAVALVTALRSPRTQRVGDVLAGTVVLSQRLPVRPAQSVRMPGALADWAARLEMSGLPDSVAEPARQFLQRAPDFDPEVRASLAEGLAAQVAGHVRPDPPPGTMPEPYLAAVLAERGRREEAKRSGRREFRQPGS